MQSSKEQPGEIRKPASAINAKKQRKTTEWERVEISSRKLETSREHFRQRWVRYRNGIDLIEAEDIKKRQQEYTEELYKKDLHNTDNHNGMITHVEPDILECESGPQKASLRTKPMDVMEFQLTISNPKR